MRTELLKLEDRLQATGLRYIAGIDEAGRGPLAGPVVASAVCIVNPETISVRGSFDSKQLTLENREMIFKTLRRHPGIEWGIGKVSEQQIDEINILQATKLAMQKAVQALEHKLRTKEVTIEYLLIDGNFPIQSKYPQQSVIKGDATILSCMLASIFAKVTRDRLMMNYHKKYPNYGFNRHMGYGTKAHYEALLQHGPCPIHRKTFLSNITSPN